MAFPNTAASLKSSDFLGISAFCWGYLLLPFLLQIRLNLTFKCQYLRNSYVNQESKWLLRNWTVNIFYLVYNLMDAMLGISYFNMLSSVAFQGFTTFHRMFTSFLNMKSRSWGFIYFCCSSDQSLWTSYSVSVWFVQPLFQYGFEFTSILVCFLCSFFPSHLTLMFQVRSDPFLHLKTGKFNCEDYIRVHISQLQLNKASWPHLLMSKDAILDIRIK